VTEREIIQAEHYYAFGMTMEGHGTPILSENQYQFNEIERCEDFELNLDLAELRSYDASIGRWLQIDPKNSERESPYVGFANNPIIYSDVLGDSAIVNLPTVEVVASKNDNSSKNYDQTDIRYGYNGTFDQWINDYGVKGWSYEQADTYWENVHRKNFDTWVNQQDKEERERKASKKLLFILYYFYIIEDAAQVYTPVPLLSGGKLAVRSFQMRLAVTMQQTKQVAKKSTGLIDDATDVLSNGDYLRIQNAATRINKSITVVGSRAKGTANAYSDWDYVIEGGLNSREWSKIKNSLPGSRSVMDNTARNIDIMPGPVWTKYPHITIFPK
jgi:RHS repeat-associated protein